MGILGILVILDWRKSGVYVRARVSALRVGRVGLGVAGRILWRGRVVLGLEAGVHGENRVLVINFIL